MSGTASALARWITALEPTQADLDLADRALLDSLAVAVAAREQRLVRLLATSEDGESGPEGALLDEAGRWAVATHIIDFDDLHMPSTTHISTVCVPVALAVGGGARDYLAGAGVMARLGTALGWAHYTAGWHATTTAGALAAAAVAASAYGLDTERTAAALALAVPASGGVQEAFGTDAKSLQVGFAADAGVRAARLARAGAGADPAAVDAWMRLLGAAPGVVTDLEPGSPAVPDGLAIKMYPCCYALQRPITAVGEVRGQVAPESVERIVVRTLAGTVTPLHHHRPATGLEGKFSLEYAVAAALLDEHPGFASFTDEAVARPEAQRLLRLVEIELTQGGDGLLDGSTYVGIHSAGASAPLVTELDLPPGAPDRPPSAQQLDRKVSDCLAGSGIDPGALTWNSGADLLRRTLSP